MGRRAMFGECSDVDERVHEVQEEAAEAARRASSPSEHRETRAALQDVDVVLVSPPHAHDHFPFPEVGVDLAPGPCPCGRVPSSVDAEVGPFEVNVPV